LKSIGEESLFSKLTIGHISVSLIAEKLAEFGVLRPDWDGLLLLASVMLVFIVLAAFVASYFKGRSLFLWLGISAAAQTLAIAVPLAVAALTGILDPADLRSTGVAIDFTTFQLFAEMSVVVGITTLVVLSFLTQTKWKNCPACTARAPWRAKTCPACASALPVGIQTTGRHDPGAKPRLRARTIHLPPELDAKLSRLASPKGARSRDTEDAAVSKYVRQLLEQFDAEAKRTENQ
jgi:hypothetical protein